MLGFQAGRKDNTGRIGEALVDHHQIRPGAVEGGLDRRTRSEPFRVDPGQGQNLDDGISHALVVIDDVDKLRPGS